MNISLFPKPKAHLLLTTLFFIGIIISGGSLYLLACNFPAETIQQTCIIVGATFLAGIISVNLISRSRRQTVVYLERSRENARVKNDTDVANTGKVDTRAIDTVIEAHPDAPQKWINELCTQLHAGQGAIYEAKEQRLVLKCGYALAAAGDSAPGFAFGEGLVGRVAAEGRTLYINPLPDGYITVFSGLGAASPSHLVIVPIKHNDVVLGVAEIATFAALDEHTRRQVEKTGETMGRVLFNQSI